MSGGLVKVENGEVLILVDTAERPEDIDANRARRDADAAREAMLQKKSIMEYRTAQATLARAVSRLRELCIRDRSLAERRKNTLRIFDA